MTAETTASTELPAAGTYRIHPEQSTVCYRGGTCSGWVS